MMEPILCGPTIPEYMAYPDVCMIRIVRISTGENEPLLCQQVSISDSFLVKGRRFLVKVGATSPSLCWNPTWFRAVQALCVLP